MLRWLRELSSSGISNPFVPRCTRGRNNQPDQVGRAFPSCLPEGRAEQPVSDPSCRGQQLPAAEEARQQPWEHQGQDLPSSQPFPPDFRVQGLNKK